jgi:hypothetical protein
LICVTKRGSVAQLAQSRAKGIGQRAIVLTGNPFLQGGEGIGPTALGVALLHDGGQGALVRGREAGELGDVLGVDLGRPA